MKQKILEFVEGLVCNYEVYEESIKELEDEHDKVVDDLLDEVNQLSDAKRASDKALKDALAKPEGFNVGDLREWYYDKHGRQNSWSYNAYSKGLVEVSQVVRSGSDDVVRKAANELIRTYRLTSDNTPEQVIESVIRFFMKSSNWSYVTDRDLYNRPEYWQSASRSWSTRKGDCFTGETKIIVKNKYTGIVCNMAIKDLKGCYEDYLALSFNENYKRSEFKPITNFLEQGIKPVFEVTPKRGSSFKCTDTHKFLKQNDGGSGYTWQELKNVDADVSQKRQLLSLVNINNIDNDDIHKDLLTLIGAYIADGTCESYRASIAGDDKYIRSELFKALDNLGLKYSQSKRTVHAYTRIPFNGNPDWFKDLVIDLGFRSDVKKFPSVVFNLSKEDVSFLLREYGKRDGTKNPDNREEVIVYSTVSDVLKEQLILLLGMVGVPHFYHTQDYQRSDAVRKPIHRIHISEGKGVSGDYRNNAIVKVEYSGLEPAYDITVEDNHNFVLSNSFIVAHNCDDLALLMHNLVYFMFEKLDLSSHYWRLKYTAMGTMVEAHAFNIWLGTDGEWYVIESTLDLRGSFMKTWLETPLKNNNLYRGRPWGFADRIHSWKGSVVSLHPYENDG